MTKPAETKHAELTREILAVADAYRVVRTVSWATLATEFYGDSVWFDKIRAGGGFNVKIYDKVMLAFSTHWPTAAVWPESIRRPAPAHGKAADEINGPRKQGASAT